MSIFLTASSFGYSKLLSSDREKAIESYFLKDFNSGSFIAVNGCKSPEVNKNSDNVRVLRNFLIEFDKMPLEEQRGYMDRLGIPYSAVVFSGSK